MSTMKKAESYKWEYSGKNIEKAFIKYSFIELQYKVLVMGDFRRSDAEKDFDSLSYAQGYILDMDYRNFPTLQRERELIKETQEALSDVLACKVHVTCRGLITFRSRGVSDSVNVNELFCYGGSWRAAAVDEIYKRLQGRVLREEKHYLFLDNPVRPNGE